MDEGLVLKAGKETDTMHVCSGVTGILNTEFTVKITSMVLPAHRAWGIHQ